MAENTQFNYGPETLSEISSLSIRAIQLVEGLLSGHHRSPHKGSSVEFAEYKDYSPGDDIRHIDWKVVGKTDKYHVKQFEQSTNLKCTILLDASGSMAYRSPDSKSPGMDKRDYARTLAAAMGYLLLKQFDDPNRGSRGEFDRTPAGTGHGDFGLRLVNAGRRCIQNAQNAQVPWTGGHPVPHPSPRRSDSTLRRRPCF
jgi:hypothetical protein